MGTAMIRNIVLAIIAMAPLAEAVAGSGSQLEAGVACSGSNCFFHQQGADAGSVRLQKINLFSSNGKDPRKSDPGALAAALAPVGMVETNYSVSDGQGHNGIAHSTAFLVSPCYVVTDHHAVFGDDVNPNPNVSRSLTFFVGKDTDGTFKWRVTGKPVAWGARTTDNKHDWALIKLDEGQCVGKSSDIGWLETELHGDNELSNRKVSIAGFTGTSSQRKFWTQPGCAIHGVDANTNTISHDCAMVHGMSGAPIFVTENGVVKVVALNNQALSYTEDVLTHYTEDHANLALNITEVMGDPTVSQYIRSDKAQFAQANPSIRKNGTTNLASSGRAVGI